MSRGPFPGEPAYDCRWQGMVNEGLILIQSRLRWPGGVSLGVQRSTNL